MLCFKLTPHNILFFAYIFSHYMDSSLLLNRESCDQYQYDIPKTFFVSTDKSEIIYVPPVAVIAKYLVIKEPIPEFPVS